MSSKASKASKAQKTRIPSSAARLDPSRYSWRYVALKIAYFGENFGGFSATGEETNAADEPLDNPVH